MLKYSRQRESIKNFLMTRTDHPTAETIYENIRLEYPRISLGTVYRNLSLLSELGEIQTIATGVGPDRFDGNAMPHYHFICKHCGAVLDLKVQGLEHINLLAQHEFSGDIEGHTVFFYGTCEKCKEVIDRQMKK
jgi:Fur family peroxide stress response transcriptional regulator